MAQSDEPTLLETLLAQSPAVLGLFSPTGDGIFLYGSLPMWESSQVAPNKLTTTTPPGHLRDLFAFVSEEDAFWSEKLVAVSSKGELVEFSCRPRGDAREEVLLALFPCRHGASGDTDNAVGLLAVELSALGSRSETSWPTTSGRTLAIIGHELRNPLSAIAAGIGVIQASSHSTSLERVGRVMKTQLDIASRLVNDLLDSTRATTASGLPVVLKDELLSDVVTATLDGFQHRITSRSHTLSVTLPESPITVRCDLVRLAQAITNLLHNASKYTPPGGHIELTVSAATTPNHITITVSDTGVGIPADKLESIFEPFSQIGDSVGHADGGVGLGLFLVKAIVEAHSGSIKVRSAGANCGSVFEILIPLRAGERKR